MSAELETGHHQQHSFEALPPDTFPPLPTQDIKQQPASTASLTEAVFSSPQDEQIHYKYKSFPSSIRKRVRREQEYRCAYCGKSCAGHQQNEPPLTVHHVMPSSLGGSNERQNAVGLCGDECHPLFDKLIFEEGKTFFQVLMEEGRIYEPLSGK
jgi:5-methylcytosine-specific restriction endonuclease McrA